MDYRIGELRTLKMLKLFGEQRMKPSGPLKSKILSIRDRLRQHAGAEKTFESLIESGCDRSLLLLLLDAKTPTARKWARLQDKVFLAHPKRLLSLACQLEGTAQALESDVVETLASVVFDLREDSVTLVDEMRAVSNRLRDLSGSAGFRAVRRKSSYRQMGGSLPTALLCHYVKSATGRPYFKEIAELLSAARETTLGEDGLRHRANRSIARLTFNGRLPGVLDAFLHLLEPPSTRVWDVNET